MAWPVDPIDVEVGLFIDGAWVDAVDTGNGVLLRKPITIGQGRTNWASRADPGRASFMLDNRDGRWSPDYALSPHAGNYRRNIPCRVGIGRGEVHMARTEVSADLASTPDIAGAGGGLPTAPAHVDVTQTTETTATTLHTYSLPATVALGDRLLLIASAGHESFAPTDQGGGVTDLDDWTLVHSGNLYTPWHGWQVYEIEAVDETTRAALQGATVNFTTSASTVSSCQVIRTSGARSGVQGVAWDFSVDTVKTFSSAPNPPSLTASYGADEQRWYAIAVYGSGGDTVSTYPASYTSIADTGGASPGLGVASAHRTTSVATEDPGTYALTGNENWLCMTFVYRAEEDTSADGVLDTAADMDVRIEIELERDLVDIVESGDRVRLAHKVSGADGWEWELYMANGVVVSNFIWRDSGGVRHDRTTEATGAELPLDFLHEHRALRVDLDVDNGAAGHDLDWYTSTDIDGTWTKLGSTITTAGVTSIKTNDAPLRAGGNPNDATHIVFPGKIYAFQLRNEIDTVVANPNFNAQALGATSFTDGAGRVWTVGTGGRITNMLWRFHGELSSLPVRWDVQGKDVWSPVEATGLFRRLRQGNRQLESAIRRAVIRSATDLVQYWPMEETGPLLPQFGAAVGTAAFVVTDDFPNTAADQTSFLASDSLPTLGVSQITVVCDGYAASNEWQIRWLQTIPAGFTGLVQPLGVITTDMDWFLQFRENNGGEFQVFAFRGLTQVYATGWVIFDAQGSTFRMALNVRQNGSNVDVGLLSQDPAQALPGGFDNLNAVAGIAGQVTAINVNGGLDVGDWTFGHFTLQSAQTAGTELATELNAHIGERAGQRIRRLCREEGIASRIEGDPATTEAMGPQRPGSLIALLEECSDTDLGILHESRETVAVGYRVRANMLDQDQRQLPDETNLVAWWSTADVTDVDQQTISDRSGVTGDATLGSTASTGDAEDPTVVLGTPTEIVPDGTNDFVQAPYTPTFTATTGELTVILVGYWNAEDTTEGSQRLFSTESANANGLFIHSSGPAIARPRLQVGGSIASIGINTASSMAAGERFGFAGVVNAGRIRAYTDKDGLTAAPGNDISGVGTITFDPGRLFARAYTNTGNASSSFTGMAIFERALTEAELDEAIDWMLAQHHSGQINLDYSAGHVAGAPELDRDDQGFANDVIVKDRSGSKARAVLDDGSILSVSEPPVGAGRYDSEFEVNTSTPDRLPELATTRLALSSPDEPRISKLAVDMHHPSLVADGALTSAIFDSSLGDLLTVINNLTVALGATTQIRQLVQGTRESIGNYTHTTNMLTTPASPWDTDAPPPTVTPPPPAHSVIFRSQNTLATSGTPPHVLDALGYTGSYPVTRAQLDGILNDWVASTGGTTHNVDNGTEWTTAMGAVVPGDLVRLTTTFDTAGGLDARHDKYGLAGSNMTDDGTADLPIILTCADGIYADDNNTSSNQGALDLINCSHVWAVGFNVRDSQFGIRGINYDGSAGSPAYVAYCNIENMGHSGLITGGWGSSISVSGGTPPAGAGNEFGFSEHIVWEENTIDGVGVIADQFGEAMYIGFGSSPGWKSYGSNIWVRGNRATDWTADGIDVKPGSRKIYITDDEIFIGHAVFGAPMGILYVAAGIDIRPAAFDFDPEVFIEGVRVYDNDITNTNVSSVHIMGYFGLSGIRVANGIFWAHPQTGTHATWRARNEHGLNDTEALTYYRNDPTWLINCTCWGDDSFENAGYGVPFVGPFPGTITFDLRNNIVDNGTPATGEVDASSADFIATVPAIGVAGDAEWQTFGKGSAFDLDPTSALVATGALISDLTLLINEDISGRTIPGASPNPGAFQQHPANL